ncbi:MAG TPA: CPBP family intramembrane glutamic endopeptidase [Candidatus Sulfotelmatobacter sp.]|nr:CPBP family intramembrane glutamic endopeptidase [Candidatus Sulfotelmatobacter sp.]
MTVRVNANAAHRPIGIGLLAGYLGLYAAMLLAMRRTGNFDIAEPLLVFGILGVGFSLAAWLLTARVSPLDYAVVSPKQELATVGAYLAPVVVFVTWGLGFLHRYFPTDPENAVVILTAKLILFVVIPAMIFQVQFGYSLRQLAPSSARGGYLLVALGMSVLLLGFQAVLGHGLRDIASAHLPPATLFYGLPLTFVWLAIEAGVVEEFFFRVLLQTRLSAVLKSELGGIVVMALAFGLAHAPGIYLRTGLTQEGLQHPSLLMAVGYSIVIVSLAGFFLGVLWARTRNFAVVVVVHAAGDLLPNLLPTLRSLHLLH